MELRLCLRFVRSALFFFLLEMFIQHTAFLLDKGSQHRRRGILPPAVSIYLMNETRRKPTTGRQSPSLFDKWHGIFYMPSRIDEAGHTKAFDYPVAEHWGESQRAKRSLVGFEPTSAHTYESEIQRSTTYATPTPYGSEPRSLVPSCFNHPCHSYTDFNH